MNAPGQYLEQLSAHLWATHQMDGFRTASEDYIHKFHASLPPETLPLRRLGIVVVGEGVAQTNYRLFRKVRRQGVYFSTGQSGERFADSARGGSSESHVAPSALRPLVHRRRLAGTRQRCINLRILSGARCRLAAPSTRK